MTLGTRIVVLKDGIIQQVDTPQNLYNTPNNIFVAGFIGSPQMNLIDAEVKANGSQVDLVLSDTVTITLPAEKSKKLIDGNYVGKTVVVGIVQKMLRMMQNSSLRMQILSLQLQLRFTSYLVQKLTFTMKSVM